MSTIAKYFQFSGFWGDRADFYLDIGESLRDKELLRDFVDGEIATCDKGSPRYRALKAMQKRMHAGEHELSTLLGAVMPEKDALALEVLRNAPDKELVLTKISESVELEKAMSSTLRQALVGPLFLIAVCMAFVWVMVNKTLPAFEAAAPAEVWVGYPWLVRSVSNLMRDYGLTYIAAVSAFWFWLISWGLPNWNNRLRLRVENSAGATRLIYTLIALPLGPVVQMLTFYRDYQASKMLAGLALILSSGRQVQDAIQELVFSASPWMRKHLRMILIHLQAFPGDYAGAFSKGILSTHLKSRMLSKTRRDAGGSFETVLMHLGTTAQTQARAVFMKNSTRLNSMLLTIALGVIAFLYIGQQMIAQGIQDQFSPSAIERRASSPAKPGP